METIKPTRKLATILAADCVNFSKLMDSNEELALHNIKVCRGLIDPIIEEHGGRIFHTAGDSVVAEFSSVVDSVNAAIEFQKTLTDRNDNVAEESQMEFRIGIHLDDVIIEGDNIYGGGVNVAARLESLCEPGCILLSRTVHEKIVKRIEIAIDNLGNTKLKNIEGDFEIYQISPSLKDRTASAELNAQIVSPSDNGVAKATKDGNLKPRLMMLPFRNLNKSEDNDFLVDGIVDDIITELSMINSIEIMSRNMTFDYKDNPIDVKEAAEKYKLNYVITGSIRSAGNRVRISAELGDPISGESIWSERYDRTMDDVFEIQDEIVSKMANTVLNEIEVTSLSRAKRKPTNKMTSYEYLLQGKFHKRKLTKEDANIAVDMFTNAIESDPNNGRAYAERCCTWADGLGYF
jgi:TolB-like protein/class 3 adenylate cyclase